MVFEIQELFRKTGNYLKNNKIAINTAKYFTPQEITYEIEILFVTPVNEPLI